MTVPAGLLAAQSGFASLSGFFAAAVLLILTARARVYTLRPLELMLLQLVLAVGAVGLYTLTVRSLGEITPFGRYLTVAMLALAVPRAGLNLTSAGRIATLIFGLLAVMGMARAVGRAPYGVATLLYLVAALLSVLQADPGFGPILRHKRGLLGPFILALGVTGGLMGFLGWGLPAAEPAVSEYLEPYLGESGSSVSGYSDGYVRLGRLREIQTSDEIVLRLEGTSVERLRGQVYSLYQVGTWEPAPALVPLEAAGEGGVLTLAPGRAGGEVTVESTPTVGRTVFAPPQAVTVSGLPPGATRDALGRIRVAADEEVSRYVIAVGDAHLVDAPRATDSEASQRQATYLVPLAQRWGLTAPDTPPSEVLARLARELSKFRYTLTFDETSARTSDPLGDFLTRTRAGHCELFATAAILLLRQAGIPARLVTGFRVVEENTVGGYSVVRGRDAHAWAEAHIAGQWQTFDPTPASAVDELRGDAAGWLGQRLDVMLRALGRAVFRLQNLSAREVSHIVLAIVFLLAAFVLVRRRARARAERAAGRAPAFEPLTALERHLAQRYDLLRPAGRTLAHQAEHLRRAGRPLAAALLDACADLRYGGLGDEVGLREKIRVYLSDGEPAQR